MERPVPLAEVRVRTQDGGLGVRGPDAAGVFGAIGWGGAVSDDQDALQIMDFGNPADAAAKLWGPLRDLVVQALSIAGTVCYAVPLRPQIGEYSPAAAGQGWQGTLNATPAPPAPYDALPWRVRSLQARVTGGNTTAGQAGGLKLVPVIAGIDGPEVTLASDAGDATQSDAVADFGGLTGLSVRLTGTAGTIPVGTLWDFEVGAPSGTAGMLAAADLLLDSRRRWEWISIAGVTTQDVWAALATKAQTALTQYNRFMHFKSQARAPAAAETTGEWATALAGAERGETNDGRVQVYAGWLRIADPITGEIETRGLSEIGAGWSARRRPHEPVDAVQYGALPGVVGLSPQDLTSAQVSTLAEAGYTVGRTYPGERGVYVAEGRTLAAATSDFKTEERRRVMDRACRLIYERQFRYLNSTVQIDGQGRMVGIRTFQRASQQPLDEMVRRQEISAGSVVIDPIQDILATETITTEVRIIPLGKLRTIVTTVSFRNPLFDAVAAAAEEE